MPNSNSKTHPTPTMNRNRNEGQRELFSGSLRQAEGAENDRTFELSFSSEEPYTRWFGPEILDHSDGCVDMSRLTEIGVDYISSGALTHSAPILDISMKNLHAIG